MNDYLICEHCNTYIPARNRSCSGCRQPLIKDAAGAISLWRLGRIRSGLLEPLMAQLNNELSVRCVLQPGFLDERPSRRPGWRGISSNVFLDQIHRLHQSESLVSLGVTEFNIVPSKLYNFLFGYAFIDEPAAIVSLHALSSDDPPLHSLVRRAAAIAVHEIGHTFNLEHHSYEEGIDCVMCGDETQDSIEHIDQESAGFCRDCLKKIERRLA